MSRFKQKYRIESARLKNWDYTRAGWYFVTICTRHHFCWFGEIKQNDIILTPAGEIVAAEWQKTAQIRHNVELDAWVIMPNHLHGIIVISDNNPGETSRRDVSTPRLQAGSLGAIIAQFKSSCTKKIRAGGNPAFGWQARYYDHIIRVEKSLDNIRKYIANNPSKWTLDKLNPINQPSA